MFGRLALVSKTALSARLPVARAALRFSTNANPADPNRISKSVSLNRVELIGNLGGMPQVSEYSPGNFLIQFTMATTERYKTKNGEWTSETEWHAIKIFSKYANIGAAKFLKGDKVYVIGKLQKKMHGPEENKKLFVSILCSGLQQDCFLLRRGQDEAASAGAAEAEAEATGSQPQAQKKFQPRQKQTSRQQQSHEQYGDQGFSEHNQNTPHFQF
eukprot:c6492_g1_i1.p1 GENE.c6492_g1_i1~~c6492_g1_i1.p1  ORF type:complete len:226 (+),score=56.42 c6492_g1_i1:35-679(+)